MKPGVTLGPSEAQFERLKKNGLENCDSSRPWSLKPKVSIYWVAADIIINHRKASLPHDTREYSGKFLCLLIDVEGFLPDLYPD